MYDLYKSPLINGWSHNLLWFSKSISVNVSGKPCRMPCFDVLIELLFCSFMLTTIVGTVGSEGRGDFPFSLAVCDVGIVDNVVVIALMSDIFLVGVGILMKIYCFYFSTVWKIIVGVFLVFILLWFCGFWMHAFKHGLSWIVWCGVCCSTNYLEWIDVQNIRV